MGTPYPNQPYLEDSPYQKPLSSKCLWLEWYRLVWVYDSLKFVLVNRMTFDAAVSCPDAHGSAARGVADDDHDLTCFLQDHSIS